ncbi:aminopeptidase [Rhizobacter sp. Root1221]|uniref:aminopeptidase n=1 Tax=Rhizobacter sp. Root1221 TaxID=1736433 RepID=UPI0009EBA932|nr:aminopeptidase [Rhizobacter sp. Root1221]
MKRWLLLGGAAAALFAGVSGCGGLGYYGQSIHGHFSLLNSARPVPDWLADPETPTPLRERLALTETVRDFAVQELKLPDNASYRRYADLKRPAAVWNVVAAPELDLTLKTWCFPIVGCVGYRGYFDRPTAEAEAASLRAEGFEAGVYPVPAYSTLGRIPGAYFSDPLLSTFIRYPEGDLARLIFHELAHQVAYAPGDTVFNESFATAVERIGVRRWLAAHASDQVRTEYERLEARREDFRALTLKTRRALEGIFRGPGSDADKRAAKAAAMDAMRAEYATLKAGPWDGFAGYDPWFERANNAALGVLGAYYEQVPQFEALFRAQGEDFHRFYAEVKRIAALPRAKRHATLAR